MKLKIATFQLIILVCLFLMPSLLHAQPGFGDDINDTAPIDGGLSLLVAAGVGYGARKVKENRKKKLGSENNK
jgi:hypothetical protein